MHKMLNKIIINEKSISLTGQFGRTGHWFLSKRIISSSPSFSSFLLHTHNLKPILILVLPKEVQRLYCLEHNTWHLWIINAYDSKQFIFRVPPYTCTQNAFQSWGVVPASTGSTQRSVLCEWTDCKYWVLAQD